VDEKALQQALAGRYAIAGTIGEGGSAVVFRARDLKHGRDVALKVLRPELAASLGHERFLKEVEIAARLSHPHIVPLHDSGVEGGFVYYVMPYVSGGSLRTVLRTSGPLALGDAAWVTSQVADAIGYAHLTGVLHRDLKPENILLAGAHAYVVDFGIAKALTAAAGDALTRTGFVLGTPGYMSPEQAAGLKDLDARTDVYGLACVVYEMLLGDVPGFFVTDAALRVGRLVDAPAAHRERLDALPGRIEQVLTRGLALRPDERWPTIGAFAAALADATNGPSARYTAAQVREIVGRAAQIEAQRPAPEETFSLATIERIAAEVDIPLEDVRRAVEELGLAPSPAAAPLPAPPLPALPAPAPPVVRVPYEAPASVRIDRVLEGEVSPPTFDGITADLERTFGRGAATVWDGALSWRTEGTPETAKRFVEVTVSPREGRTRVQIAEWRSKVPGRVAAGVVGVMAGGSVASIIAFLLGGQGDFAMFLAMIGMIAGAVLFDRSWRRGDLENETRRVEELMARIPTQAGERDSAAGREASRKSESLS